LRRDYPLVLICRVLQVPRSGVYAGDGRERGQAGAAMTQSVLRSHIEQIAMSWPT
jgi:hypothetical protein